MKPRLTLNINALKHNAQTLVNQCQEYGIQVTGVTKVALGNPTIGKIILQAGASSLGESRLENLECLRLADITQPLLLLRLPHISEASEVIRLADFSLNSEIAVVKALSVAALHQKKSHGIIVMVDMGDLREGLMPKDLENFVEQVLKLSGVKLMGFGMNLTDLNGVLPTLENNQEFVSLVEKMEQRFNIKSTLLSAGNSSSLPLMQKKLIPSRINHMRIGEAIMLGVETAYRQPWEGLRQDTFTLSAEIIELKTKPSVPWGEIGEDAFGGKPDMTDTGPMLRAIINIGRQDTRPDGLEPLDQRMKVVGATSDQMIIDVTNIPHIKIGDRLEFRLNYGALLAAMTSPFIEKYFI